MTVFGDSKPIVAVSTGLKEKSALGIVRVSGVKDLDFLEELTHRKSPIQVRRAYFSRFYAENEVLDEGLFIFFKGPHSFTGENVVEFNLHGNPLILQNFADHLVKNFDFRHANPGEFTYRALKNQKLNLTQVEGLDLILNANSSFGLSAGTKLLNNELYRDYQALRDGFREIKATVELLIDFAEDVGEDEAYSKLNRDVASFKEKISQLKKRVTGDLDKLLSPKVVLVGPTNAGKSTLFNQLLGDNRAIVSDIHGTTRDYISEYISINGDSFRLVDTAGLRETSESVEKEGIERSLRLFEAAFYKIFVLNPLDEIDDNYHAGALKNCDAVLFTHNDCDGFESALKKHLLNISDKWVFSCGPMGAYCLSGPIGAKNETGPIGPNLSGPIGAKNETGPIGPNLSGPIGATLESVISTIYKSIQSDNPIPIQRHRNEILSIYDTFKEFSITYETTRDAAILSSLVNRLGAGLDQLIGVVSPQEVLDHIFSNFCIGK